MFHVERIVAVELWEAHAKCFTWNKWRGVRWSVCQVEHRKREFDDSGECFTWNLFGELVEGTVPTRPISSPRLSKTFHVERSASDDSNFMQFALVEFHRHCFT